MNLSSAEIEIMLQCIYALNFSGKDVALVGSLVSKLQNEIKKQEPPK